jgi:raffinose/stachyose/melibiose transport system permease protein/N-acetylglucosamine transport system permease protein
MTSLKTNKEYFAKVWGFPAIPRFVNYAKVLGAYHLGLNFLNSLIVVAVSVTFIILISTPAAYILSRFDFKGVKFLNRFFTLGMGVPFQLLLIPLFFILYRFRLVGGHAGLIIVYVSLSIPFTIFLVQGFFRTLPSVLEEAAYIDGCSPMRTFFSIMLPIGRPGIITAAIFNFISLWNEFLLALTFLSDSDTYTLPIGLYALQGAMQYTGDWVSLFAAVVVVTIPTLVVYLLLSRQIIEGLTMGAVKE